MFMDFLGYGNHVELYSEEISRGGEGLGVSLFVHHIVKYVLTCRAEHASGILTRYAYFCGVQP